MQSALVIFLQYLFSVLAAFFSLHVSLAVLIVFDLLV
jgi:hypothetical protein